MNVGVTSVLGQLAPGIGDLPPLRHVSKLGDRFLVVANANIVFSNSQAVLASGLVAEPFGLATR